MGAAALTKGSRAEGVILDPNVFIKMRSQHFIRQATLNRANSISNSGLIAGAPGLLKKKTLSMNRALSLRQQSSMNQDNHSNTQKSNLQGSLQHASIINNHNISSGVPSTIEEEQKTQINKKDDKTSEDFEDFEEDHTAFEDDEEKPPKLGGFELDEKNGQNYDDEEDLGPKRIDRVDEVNISYDSNGTPVVNDCVRIYETIGQGGFGKVKKAIVTIEEEDGTLDQQVMAIKEFNKKMLGSRSCTMRDKDGNLMLGKQLDVIYNEIEVQEKLDHWSVCKIFQLFDTEDSDKMFLVMQYCDMGQILDQDKNTRKFIRKPAVVRQSQQKGEYLYLEPDLSDEEKGIKYIFRQVARGLQYLHKDEKVAHRDIKPENILMMSQTTRVKIGDYTVAIDIPDDNFTLQDFEGTLYFKPPESLTGEPYKPYPADIWAFAVSLYSYITLEFPFDSDNEPDFNDKLLNTQPLYPEYLSENLRDLLKKLFVKDPSKRLNIDEILQHPWMHSDIDEYEDQDAGMDCGDEEQPPDLSIY
eukprot:403374345